MSKHQVNLADLKDFETISVVASAYGKGQNKKLAVVNNIDETGRMRHSIQVFHNYESVLKTSSFKKAVKHYNAL